MLSLGARRKRVRWRVADVGVINLMQNILKTIQFGNVQLGSKR